jgi:hypothetical protein
MTAIYCGASEVVSIRLLARNHRFHHASFPIDILSKTKAICIEIGLTTQSQINAIFSTNRDYNSAISAMDRWLTCRISFSIVVGYCNLCQHENAASAGSAAGKVDLSIELSRQDADGA